METRANYILIGAFTLAVLVAGFGFVFWFSRSGNEAERATYRVVFDGSVSGLRTGGVVLFNGIKVGEVTDLKLNPQDPRQAIATIGIDKSIPIRADTRANLEYQGLTGIASVALKGGQADAPLLPTRVGEVPTISAEAIAVQDLAQGAREIMGRADSILRRVDIFLADNESGVRNVVRNIEKFTGALGDNSDDVAAFIKDAAAAARRIAALSDNIDKLAGDLSDLVKAVDPSKVASMVDNVDKVIKGIDPNKVAGVIDNAETLTKGLAASTDQIVAFVEDARSVAAKLNDIAGKLDPTLDRVGDIVKAIDPAKVASVVDNVDKVIGAIDPDKVAGAIDSVDRIVKAIDPSKLASVIDNADVFTQSLAGSSEKITAFMNDAQALAGRLKDMSDRLDPTVTRLGEVVGAVDPQRVQRTVENVERFTDALGRNSVNVDSLLKDAADVARKFNDMSASIDSTLKRANDVLQAVDPQKIERTVANVDKFTESLGQNSEKVDGLLKDAADIARKFNDMTPRIERILVNVEGLTGSEDGKGLMTEIADAAKSIRKLADNLDKRVAEISTGLSRFTGQGLREWEALAADGRRTLGELDRAVRNFDRNPQRVIFGGSGGGAVPQYGGRR